MNAKDQNSDPSIGQETEAKVTLSHIGWAYGATDISLIRSIFQSVDIPVFIQGEHIHTTLSHQAVAMGGARIMVFSSDIEVARPLLALCSSTPKWRFSALFITFLLLMTFLFAVLPIPYRAVYLRDPRQGDLSNVL